MQSGNCSLTASSRAHFAVRAIVAWTGARTVAPNHADVLAKWPMPTSVALYTSKRGYARLFVDKICSFCVCMCMRRKEMPKDKEDMCDVLSRSLLPCFFFLLFHFLLFLFLSCYTLPISSSSSLMMLRKRNLPTLHGQCKHVIRTVLICEYATGL